jgi:ATP-dependent Lon protease
VRNLERELAGLCRKVARRKASNRLKAQVRITPRNLSRFLGPERFLDSVVERQARVGVANGLAWTETGGDLLTIEVSILPGKGELLLTGKLGEVMRESGQAALSYARSRAAQLGLDKWFYRDIDIHVHVPEGAMPKDGPSAGITMATALISALTGVPTKPDVAMTGEITLRGTVLAIGGLNEKAVAARRAGLKTVLIPGATRRTCPRSPRTCATASSSRRSRPWTRCSSWRSSGPSARARRRPPTRPRRPATPTSPRRPMTAPHLPAARRGTRRRRAGG